MTSLTNNNRRKKNAKVDQQQLANLLGIDLTQKYNPDTFVQYWCDLVQSEDFALLPKRGQEIYNILKQLVTHTTAITPTQRRTKVWYQHTLELAERTDSELVDDLLSTYGVVFKPIRTEEQEVSFVAIEVGSDD